MDLPKHLLLPVRAASEIATAHGVVPDRCEILQDGNTLVLRLTESLVARIVTDRDGPRQGTEWFAREIGVAAFLASRGAPVIPLHPDVPPGPHEHFGYALNFWQYIHAIPEDPAPAEIGRTLFACHRHLRDYPETLPELAILDESAALLGNLAQNGLFPPDVIALLATRLNDSSAALRRYPMQALHGDAHIGNLMHSSSGLLWTDWEDAFLGPVEWDLASIIWNARILDGDETIVSAILNAYKDSGGVFDDVALQHSLVARAAVMSAWYPILYPNPTPERLRKLELRLDWLKSCGFPR